LRCLLPWSAKLLLNGLLVVLQHVFRGLLAILYVVSMLLTESCLLFCYFHCFESRVDLVLVIERHSLLLGDHAQVAPVHASGIVLSVVLSHLHVVREGLPQWPINHHQESLTTWLRGVLPIQANFPIIELIHARLFSFDGMPCMNFGMVPQIVADMLVDQVILVNYIRLAPHAT